MTKAEAVEILKTFVSYVEDVRTIQYRGSVTFPVEALNIGIEALEQEETLQNLTEPNKSDLISRQDLINAIMRSSVYAWSAEEDKIAHEWVLNIINSLPAE